MPVGVHERIVANLDTTQSRHQSGVETVSIRCYRSIRAVLEVRVYISSRVYQWTVTQINYLIVAICRENLSCDDKPKSRHAWGTERRPIRVVLARPGPTTRYPQRHAFGLACRDTTLTGNVVSNGSLFPPPKSPCRTYNNRHFIGNVVWLI